MRKAIWILGAALVVAVLAVPAFAGWRVISDTFDRQTGIGVAVLQLDNVHYAEIRYRDTDRSMSFTMPDTRLHVRYFLREVSGASVSLKRLG